MLHPEKNQIWVFGTDIETRPAADGVARKILAFSDALMCAENHFITGARGPLHSHPHTQITYVVSGRFVFSIDGVEKEVAAGDTMLKQDGIEHGCLCLEEGTLLDIFTPMREDFV